MARVLIVDDHPTIRHALCREFEAHGHVALSASTGEEAVEIGRRQRPHAAIVDLVLPALDGFGAFAALRIGQPDLVGIAISGVLPEGEAQERCRREGFVVFRSKHSDLSSLVEIVERAVAPTQTEDSPETLDLKLHTAMIGNCPAMLELYRSIARVAPTGLTVLIEGETGTGKELVARAIHSQSRRSDRPLVAVNSAGLPREILESELFGSERGAFTDAVAREGLFERASGGTLFLDEIAELSAGAQAVLLRVLDQKVMCRLGGRREMAVDVRVIAATNTDLRHAVRDGGFREDLYHRLAQITMRIPPLWSRGDDLQLLADVFMDRICRTLQGTPRRLSASAWAALRNHRWPGNVRELQNVLAQACTLARDEMIHAGDLLAIMAREDSDAPLAIPARRAGLPLADALQQIMVTAERQWIVQALARTGTRKAAAAELGIDAKTLYRKMEAYRIKTPAVDL